MAEDLTMDNRDDVNSGDVGEDECEEEGGAVIDLTAEEIDDDMEDILFSKEDTRVAISYYFLRVLGVPPESEWTSKNGAIHKTLRVFNLKYARKNRTNYLWVRNIFIDLLEAIAKCKKFRTIKRYNMRGRAPILQIKSNEAIILTNTIEGGLGLRFARGEINKWRSSFGLPKVRLGAVFGLHKSLKPVRKKIAKRKTGKRDKESPWAIARFNWCRQLLVSFGVIRSRDDYDDYKILQPVQKEFSPEPDCVPKRSIYRTAFWDEHHKQCTIGFLGTSTTNEVILYPKDEHGYPDPQGKIPKTVPSYLNVKHPCEVRLALGVALILDEEGKEKGVRLPPYHYTNAIMRTRKQIDTYTNA